MMDFKIQKYLKLELNIDRKKGASKVNSYFRPHNLKYSCITITIATITITIEINILKYLEIFGQF